MVKYLVSMASVPPGAIADCLMDWEAFLRAADDDHAPVTLSMLPSTTSIRIFAERSPEVRPPQTRVRSFPVMPWPISSPFHLSTPRKQQANSSLRKFPA